MTTHTAQRVPTVVGDLYVETGGSGPAAVLWHSLFVDSRSWGGVRDRLAFERTLVVIDGPGHGRSGSRPSLYTLEDCARAAMQILDHLGIDQPVDWLGNAWGGHVGIVSAVQWPQRLRSLITIGTPVYALPRAQRWMQIYPLVSGYRLGGPVGPLTTALFDALLGEDAIAQAPALAEEVIGSFRSADRLRMYTAMRSVMLNRPDLTACLRSVRAPTVMIAAEGDRDWNLRRAQAATEHMPNAVAVAARGSGHVSPLLLDQDRVIAVAFRLWRAPLDYVARRPIIGL